MTMKQLSRDQFGALKDVAKGTVTMDSLRACRDVTVWSLLKRGYCVRSGDYLLLTEEGNTALQSYRESRMPQRKIEKDLTTRTNNLLQLVRLRKRA